MAKNVILLGPVIGLVTHNSARILVEFELEGNVTCVLKEEKTQKQHSQMIKATARIPIVFKFDKLPENVYFEVLILDVKEQISSCFKTIKREINDKTFRVAVCGCNNAYYNELLGDNALYHDVAKRARNREYDYCFHNGDQVYVDHKTQKTKNKSDDHNDGNVNIYDKCLAMIKDEPDPLKWSNYKNQILEEIRILYRKSWSGSVGVLLANVPNLMQLDDHEIHNNIGFDVKYTKKDTHEEFICNCARRIYYEYQRQLREDVDFINYNGVNKEHYYHIFSQIAVIFSDLRGYHAWHKEEGDKSYMGRVQTKFFEKLLTANGPLRDCKCVIVIHGNAPVVHNYEVCKADDEMEEFIFNMDKEPDEYKNYLNAIYNFKMETRKEVLVIGGDLHIGGYTEIYKNGKAAFKQIVTSGIAQRSKESLNVYLKEMMGQTDNTLPGGFSFIHHDWTNIRNYLSLSFKWDSDIHFINMKAYLTTSDRTIPFKIEKEQDNFTYSKDDKPYFLSLDSTHRDACCTTKDACTIF